MPFFMSFFSIIGAQTTMRTFKVLFGCSLNENILSQTNYLSKRLQEGVVTATDAMMRAEKMMLAPKFFKSSWRKEDAVWKLISQFCLEIVSIEIKRCTSEHSICKRKTI